MNWVIFGEAQKQQLLIAVNAGDYNMMRKVIDGSNLKADIKNSIREKLNPSKMLNPSIYRIGKLTSLNGEMGRLLMNFTKIKNSTSIFNYMQNIKNARDHSANLVKRLNEELRSLNLK
jgi:hypothetical protein